MSKVLICDWCKQQIERKDIKGGLSMATKSRKEADKFEYDLCEKCWEKISKRLESPMVPAVIPIDQSYSVDSDGVSIGPATRKDWIEQVEDDKIPTDQPLEGEVKGPVKKGRSKASKKEGVIEATETNPECPHYNKTQITIPKDGSRPYQKCRECGELLEYSKKELDMKTEKGVTYHDNNK